MSIGTRKSFGTKVRALRKEQDISLRRFALMINIDKNFLVDIEYGRKAPSLDTIEKIARGLDLTLSQLFEGVEMPADMPPGPAKSAVEYRFIGKHGPAGKV